MVKCLETMGNLLLNLKEKDEILSDTPSAEKLIRPYMGSEEFIDGKKKDGVYGLVQMI